jgi:hypothetical protein
MKTPLKYISIGEITGNSAEIAVWLFIYFLEVKYGICS